VPRPANFLARLENILTNENSKNSSATKGAQTSGIQLIEGTDEELIPPQPKVLPIARTVQRYLFAIRGIGQTATIALPHITKWKIEEIKSVQKKIKKFVPEMPAKEQKAVRFTLDSARDFAEFTDTIRKLDDLRGNNATAIISKSLFTQLFAEFDTYTGELLKVIYLKNDKLLKGISREISLSDLLDFDDLNAVKRAMLEKEIETFRRDSYIEQFASLEKKFGISLRKFREWSHFVELSQRRNILTHNGGVVSDQYLVVCEREGHKFPSKPKIGDSLGVTFEYFSAALRLLSKVGLMLAYTLWSKVFPKEHVDIHRSLNDTIFHCLEQKRWHLVSELEDFVLSDPMRRDITEIDLRIRIVNSAIGLKFSGKDAEAVKLLQSCDWSASYRDFKLATAVLEERYDDAVEIMKSIGKTGEIIEQSDYHTWPLFTKFRERPEFYAAYFQIYGEPFSEKVETSDGSVEAQAKTDKTQSNEDTNVVDVISKEIVKASPAAKKVSSTTPSIGKRVRKNVKGAAS
jgi:hypothetical protein